MRRAALLLALCAAVAPAADRRPFVSSFARLRVDGPVTVTVATGRSPGATVAGDVEEVEVRQEGDTVFVRRLVAAEPRARAEPVAVALATPTLASVALVGAGAVSVTGWKADRADLSVAGSGTIAVTGGDAAELRATVIGTGRITAAGRAARARLQVNGPGVVDAAKLDTGVLSVLLDGPGEVTAAARFTAAVSDTGLGRVTVTGNAKCAVSGGGPVTCGAGKRNPSPSP